MNRSTILALAAVAAIAYYLGAQRAARAAAQAPAVTPGLASGGTDWMNWQATS